MKRQQAQMKNWIEDRPFLEEIARFHQIITSILEPFQDDATSIEIINFDVVKDDFKRGIPILKCDNIYIPIVDKASQAFHALASLADHQDIPAPFRSDCQKLKIILEKDETISETTILSLINEDVQKLAEVIEKHQLNKGVIWFLSWTALSHALQPYLPSIMKWQKQQQWDNGYCPTCGSLPNMAQLVRSDKGRQRHLSCGCCKTKWKFKRIACPYCKSEDQELLRIMEVEAEDDIRIDVCNSCKGYIKTYTSQGEESIVLADWSTLHLDLLIKEKGYLKMGTHLLDLS